MSSMLIMAMDYGTAFGASMGNYAVSALNATFSQVKSLYLSKSDAQLWQMLGVTPMIGQNDTSNEVFSQTRRAQTVATFAKSKKLGRVSYWALQRDQLGSGNLSLYSGVNKSNYEFYRIFTSAQ